MTKPPPPALLIVDGNAILHRAYHALPPMTAPDGRVVHAAYGFLSVFFKALVDLAPSHVAVTFDLPGGTFRNDLFPDYQAQREEKPDELYAQIPMIKELLAGLNVPVYEAAGFEADDVIGTIVERSRKPPPKADPPLAGTAASRKLRTIILTGDKDLLQLVGDGVEVVLLRRGMTDISRYGRDAVIERFGFGPERIPDFKALAGDPSDNYPGVPGVGEKTATELVQAFGDIAHILKAAAAKRRPESLSEKLAAKLRDHAADARLGLQLSTIVRDAPVEFQLADCERRGYDRDAVVAALRELGFSSLLGRLPTPSPDARAGTGRSPSSEEGEKGKGGRGGVGPITEILADAPAIRSAIADAHAAGAVTIAAVARGDDIRHGHPLALGLAWGDRAVGIHPWGTALAEGVSVLRDAEVAKDAHGAKSLLHLLHRSRIDLPGLRYDTEILSYLLAPGSRNHDLAHVTFAELGLELSADDEDATPESAAERAAREAAIVQKLVPILSKKIEDAGLTRVYEEFEQPLIPVLFRMEAAGIRLDVAALERLGKDMRKEFEAADRAIFKLAGEEFNIDSPIQLKRILFEKLGLAVRGIKKTAKGGTLSTAAAELEKLRGAHPIIAHLFTHRELGKLLSTYVEALPALVEPTTGHVHTTYHQTVAATGRLSSSDPNLQNIPVSEPWGPAIRSAFIAEDGWQLLALDYSQFELRIAATLSGDRVLAKAFRSGQDIHAATGAEVFGVAPESVTRDQRRVAKAINFGILYGMGAGALAATAGISRAEAEEYISRYFQVYAGLHEWIETTKALARKRGYVETLFGRKRFLPEITSGVPMVRAAAERMAVNMPVQGTQADLIKRAMIRSDAWIRGVSFSPANLGGEREGVVGSAQHMESVRLILTVHDELVFEVRENFVEEATRELRGILEGVEKLTVPIVVEAKAGASWGTMDRV
ncbi:MAG: DNA polymerase I [bacterium]|nr:DNA polymerase I [bacterium]